MFTDQRSKKVIILAHCIINQNAKIDRCAYYPGAMKEVTQYLLDEGIGLIQLPCPELLLLGLDRRVDPTIKTTIASEDTRVARLMLHAEVQTNCSQLAHEVLYQIEEYTKNNFQVIGILGINGSPTCGVELNWGEDREEPQPGVFMKAIQNACLENNLHIPIHGIRASQPVEALEIVRKMCNGTI